MSKPITERNGLEAASGEIGSGQIIVIGLAALPVVAAAMLFASHRDHKASSDEPAEVSNDPSLAREAAAQHDAAGQDKNAPAHDSTRAERQTAAQTAEKGDRFTRWNWV